MNRPLVVVAILGAIVFCRRHDPAEIEACAFEQQWFDGDIHFNQELVFDAEGFGNWTSSGMDSDAPQKRIHFRWQRDRTKLTAVVGRERRTVGYKLSRRSGVCYLLFDGDFVDRDQSRHYSNRR